MRILDYIEYINEAKLSGSLVLKERKIMRKLLRDNVLTFEFQKRDGSIRKAHGTLHPDFLPPIKGTGGPKPAYQMVYYDLDKFAWRSFRSFKFIKILKKEPVTDDIVADFMLKKEEEEKKRAKERSMKEREERARKRMKEEDEKEYRKEFEPEMEKTEKHEEKE